MDQVNLLLTIFVAPLDEEDTTSSFNQILLIAYSKDVVDIDACAAAHSTRKPVLGTLFNIYSNTSDMAEPSEPSSFFRQKAPKLKGKSKACLNFL